MYNVAMEYISASESISSELLSRLDKTPVVIQERGEGKGVLLSPMEYEMYRKLKKHNAGELRRICQEISEEAEENGMTDEILQSILNEIDQRN